MTAAMIWQSIMTDTVTNADRDEATGRFLPGNTGTGGGRPRGSRNRLGEQFIEDLRCAWIEHGVEALRRTAEEEPAQFVRVVASLLPRDLNINATVGVNAENALQNFRMAVEILGNKPPASLPKVVWAHPTMQAVISSSEKILQRRVFGRILVAFSWLWAG